jgi:predicted nucleotidyltransferase
MKYKKRIGDLMSEVLQELYRATLRAFIPRPEVQKISLFGSMEQNKQDDYSDIDLSIVSSDFDRTMKDFVSAMNLVGDPFVWYPFHLQAGNTSYAILFRDYPLYNRLDITILDTFTPSVVAPGTCIYRNSKEYPSHSSTYQPPHMEEKVRLLYGYSIGALRYVKYRKRRKPLSAYKFYQAQCEYSFLKRYEKATGEVKTKMDLSVFMRLDQLPDSGLQQYLYPENEQAMNRLYLGLLDAMLHEEQATFSTDHLEAFTRIITFVREELDSLR